MVYAELNRRLDMLEVPETDPIRAWKRGTGDLRARHEETEADAIIAHAFDFNTSSDVITLIHSPSASHVVWTQKGFAALKTRPSWEISHLDSSFSKSDQIGEGSFGAVYKGAWLNMPVVVKFMGMTKTLPRYQQTSCFTRCECGTV